MQVDSIDLKQIGPQFEKNAVFPARTNTEFIEVNTHNSAELIQFCLSSSWIRFSHPTSTFVVLTRMIKRTLCTIHGTTPKSFASCLLSSQCSFRHRIAFTSVPHLYANPECRIDIKALIKSRLSCESENWGLRVLFSQSCVCRFLVGNMSECSCGREGQELHLHVVCFSQFSMPFFPSLEPIADLHHLELLSTVLAQSEKAIDFQYVADLIQFAEAHIAT